MLTLNKGENMKDKNKQIQKAEELESEAAEIRDLNYSEELQESEDAELSEVMSQEIQLSNPNLEEE